jgi:hypothetical protein
MQGERHRLLALSFSTLLFYAFFVPVALAQHVLTHCKAFRKMVASLISSQNAPL